MTGVLIDGLGFLLGHWEGTGWHLAAGGVRSEFRQTEDVRAVLGGALLTVEGLGVGPSGEVVHRAFAIASHEAEAAATRTYRWEAFTPGHRTETVLDVIPRGFAWSMTPAPTITMHYRATVEDDTWTETGVLVRDGAPPTTVLQMTLRRRPGTEDR